LPKHIFQWALSATVLAVLAYSSSAQAPRDRLKQVVEPYVDTQMFMGSIFAKNGKVIFSKSYGMADLEWNVPNSSTLVLSPPLLTRLHQFIHVRRWTYLEKVAVRQRRMLADELESVIRVPRLKDENAAELSQIFLSLF